MGTRAVYSFIDEHSVIHVYKHYDGYPSGAHGFIEKAAKAAWPLPRFEADEFAAAFVAANKGKAGGIRLMPSGDIETLAPPDLDYRYEIRFVADKLEVRAFERPVDKLIYRGDLAGLAAFAESMA